MRVLCVSLVLLLISSCEKKATDGDGANGLPTEVTASGLLTSLPDMSSIAIASTAKTTSAQISWPLVPLEYINREQVTYGIYTSSSNAFSLSTSATLVTELQFGAEETEGQYNVSDLAPNQKTWIHIKVTAPTGEETFLAPIEVQTVLTLSQGVDLSSRLPTESYLDYPRNDDTMIELNGQYIMQCVPPFVESRTLCKVDKTTGKTTHIKDILPGVQDRTIPYGVVNGNVIFGVWNYATESMELWKSDGTEAGTQEIVGSTFTGDWIALSQQLSNHVVFINEGDHSIWVTDGTVSGTKILVDINGSGDDGVDDLYLFNDKVYFHASNGTYGEEVWVTDGTTAGTQILFDAQTGTGSSYPSQFTTFSGSLYYVASSGGAFQLVKSDGTPGGTGILTAVGSGSGTTQLGYARYDRGHAGSSKMYFVTTVGGSDYQVWYSDGTALGTGSLVNLNTSGNDQASIFFANSSGVAFFAETGSGEEILFSNGTPGNTTTLLDESTYTFTRDSGKGWTYNKSHFFFHAQSNGLNFYFTSDGTPSGTGILETKDTEAIDAHFYVMYDAAGKTFLYSPSNVSVIPELLQTDGTTANTTRFSDLDPRPKELGLTDVCGQAYSTVFDLKIDVNSGEVSQHGLSSVESATLAYTKVFKDECFYLTFDTGAFTFDLYRTTSGLDGGQLWLEDRPGFPFNGGGLHIEEYNEELYYFTMDFTGGFEVSKIDLDTYNTTVDFSVSPTRAGSFYDVAEVHVLDSSVVAFIQTSTELAEPFLFDGSDYTLIKDINPGAVPSITTIGFQSISLGDKVLFAAEDGVNGVELWVTDGSNLNTVEVKDINSGSADSDPRSFVKFGNKAAFLATTSAHGEELWISDGTGANTTMVSDFNASPDDSLVENVIAFREHLYFNARNASSDKELWKIDQNSNLQKCELEGELQDYEALSPVAVHLGYAVFIASRSNGNSSLWTVEGTTCQFRKIQDLATTKVKYQGAYGNSLFFTAGYFDANGATLIKLPLE